MTILNDELQRALSWAQSTHPQIESKIEDGSVYMNYEFSTAVLIEVEYDSIDGTSWYAVAMSWDRTHGVSGEHEIAHGSLKLVTDAVDDFLAEQFENQRRIDEILEQMPEN